MLLLSFSVDRLLFSWLFIYFKRKLLIVIQLLFRCFFSLVLGIGLHIIHFGMVSFGGLLIMIDPERWN